MPFKTKVIYCHPWNFGRLALFTEDKINILFNRPVLELPFYTAFQLLNNKVLSCENTLIRTLRVSVQHIMPLRNS